MAHRRQAIKKIRTDKRRLTHNIRVRSELKTTGRKLESFISNKKVAEASQQSRVFFSKLDKAVKKGLIHKNRASRTKSRLSIRLNNLKAKAS